MKSTILSHNATYADKLAELLDPPNGSHADLNNSAVDQSAEKIASPSSKATAAASPSSPCPTDNAAADASKPVNNSGSMDEDAQELLERFKLQEGKLLNDSYEETKETLRLSKLRQKEIISLLNNQKAIIDSLTSQLADLDTLSSSSAASSQNSETLAAEGSSSRTALERQLDDAKRSYKSAHTEMKLCKDQIAETQSLKKRAMVSLLQEFAEFQAAFKIS